MDPSIVVKWALVGILGTLVMDLLAGAGRATHLIHGVPPELIAKWFKASFTGKIFTGDIRTAPGEPGSIPFFLIFHYLIGVSFGVALGLTQHFLKIEVSWWFAVLFGFATTAAPAFLMFPGMGFGVFGLQGPPEWKLLLTSIVNHFFFGVGLAVAWRLIIGTVGH